MTTDTSNGTDTITSKRAEVTEQIRNRSGWYYDRYVQWRDAGYGLGESVYNVCSGLSHDEILTMQSVAEQLTENTGRALCDSGGYYGRHWEQNEGKTWQSFRDAPRTTVDTYTGDNEPDKSTGLTNVESLDITMSVFHVLVEGCSFDPELDAKFVKWGKSGDRADEPWLGLAEQWLEHIRADPTHLSNDCSPCNTYNGESALSQVLQFIPFEYNDTGYVLVSTHNGCDVRGGYSRPRVYECDADTATMLNGARLSAYAPAPECADPSLIDGCEPTDYTWDSDDAGYSWTGTGNAYPIREPEWGDGQLLVDADEQLYWREADGHTPRKLDFDFFIGH